jgi:hypothetical protein
MCRFENIYIYIYRFVIKLFNCHKIPKERESSIFAIDKFYGRGNWVEFEFNGISDKLSNDCVVSHF